MIAPTLTTARLTLRAPAPGDEDASVPFWMSVRSRFMGGPLTEVAARAEWPEVLDQWPPHNFGMFVITETGDDRAMGLAGLWFPATHPEPELGWNLWDAAHEGQGFAREAVSAARDWFFATTDHRSAVSYINMENHRSQHLARSLGARPDPEAACPYPPPVSIWRHHAGGAA